MKHLLSARDLTRGEAVIILDTAEAMVATQRHVVKKLPTLRGKAVVNPSSEGSTRTRLSFRAVTKRLSVDVINLSARGSLVPKGESLKGTAQTIMAMGAGAVIIRHSACGAAHLLTHASWTNMPALNAGDGTHQHPTQALLDVMTLRRWYILGAPVTTGGSPCPQGRDLEGTRLIVVGDVLHSRVARSDVDLMTALGAKVTLVVPPTLLLVGMDDQPCEISYNLDEATKEIQPDAVMILRIQRERMSATGGGFLLSPTEYSSIYGLASARRRAIPEHAIVMHSGPIDRGLEIITEAADDPRSHTIEQVGNGASVRMAAFYLLLADEGNQL